MDVMVVLLRNYERYNVIHVVIETVIIPIWWYRVRKNRPNAWKSLAFVSYAYMY